MSTIQSIHHVTATVDQAQSDLDFYRGVLGLRLVKRTVNFDNHRVFHFYYGDERGTPGTIMTTFPYKGMGVRVGRKGPGQVTATAFSVPAGSLDDWRARLDHHKVDIVDHGLRFGEPFLQFHDPSSLVIELIGTSEETRAAGDGGTIPPAMAIRGIDGVTLSVSDAQPTLSFLEFLGFTTEVIGPRSRVTVGPGGPGHRLDIVTVDAPPAINGLGTVHHVALAVATSADQLAFRERLLQAGRQVTEVKDRQYFTSIYFREPGGVLYEIATVGPGFAVDEAPAELGTGLKLPPWEEPNRASIETSLPPIVLR